MSLTESCCPECGRGVPVDEDGCCASCGATATGPALDEILKRLDALEAGLKQHELLARLPYPAAVKSAWDAWRKRCPCSCDECEALCEALAGRARTAGPDHLEGKSDG